MEIQINNLTDATTKELRQMAEELSLPKKGRKADLIERISQALEAPAEPEVEVEVEAETEEPKAEPKAQPTAEEKEAARKAEQEANLEKVKDSLSTYLNDHEILTADDYAALKDYAKLLKKDVTPLSKEGRKELNDLVVAHKVTKAAFKGLDFSPKKVEKVDEQTVSVDGTPMSKASYMLHMLGSLQPALFIALFLREKFSKNVSKVAYELLAEAEKVDKSINPSMERYDVNPELAEQASKVAEELLKLFQYGLPHEQYTTNKSGVFHITDTTGIHSLLHLDNSAVELLNTIKPGFLPEFEAAPGESLFCYVADLRRQKLPETGIVCCTTNQQVERVLTLKEAQEVVFPLYMGPTLHANGKQLPSDQ